jgi:hypothetical protein
VSIGAKSQLSYVFLVCSERSGSNLIREIIGGHSKVYAPPSLHIGRHLGARFYHYVIGDRNPQLQSLIKIELEKRIERHFGPDKARDFKDFIEKKKFHGFDDIFDLIYIFLSSGSGKKMIFIKENNIIEQMPYILHHFPDSKFVFQVRDPRDYFASVISLKNGWLKSKYGSTKHALDVWRSDQLCGLNLISHLGPNRVHFHRYEDLLQNPDIVLSRLCDFLSIEFEGSMLDFHSRASVVEMSHKNTAWSNLKKPLITDNTNKFKSKVRPPMLKVIETYLGDLMDVFGYERAFEVKKSVSAWSTILPLLTEPIERYRNDELVPYPTNGGVGFLEKMKLHSSILKFPF